MNILEIWEVVKMAAILLLLLGLVILTLYEAITGEWYGLSEKVRYPWEKEERKKAKAEKKRKQNKKWYEN